MVIGAWEHKYPAAKDGHPEYIDWPNENWDLILASFFHHVFTALDAIQEALGYITAFVGLYRSAVQSIPNNTWTSVSFDQEFQDIGDYHEGVTNPTRITVSAATAGHQLVTFRALFAVAGGGDRQARVLKNGVDVVGFSLLIPGDPANPIDIQHLFPVFSIAPDDYFELQVWQNSGGAIDLTGGTTGSTFFVKRLAG